ncbi:MAG TPA: hypothetical protein VLS89_00525 [Candidatus Nanopelagicales bacterium]|nr:hypothetical protein [Candidatus Nanopelagicales bacterium]
MAATLVAAEARAADPTAGDRERARALLFDGREKLEAGDIEAAVRSFQAAHAIMGVPTTGLDLAKGLVALGKLIDARALALEVTRMPPAPDEPKAFIKARDAAAALAEDLNARIPALVITVKETPGARPQVLVDGTAVPAEALGLPWKVNPGEHIIAVAAAGFRAERRAVTVKEAESLAVELALSPSAPAAQSDAGGPARPAAGAALAGSGASSSRSGADVTGGDAADITGREVPTWAWVSGGAGLVALGVGAVFAIDYASVRGTVADDCPADVCDWTRYDDGQATALESRWNRSLGLAVGLGAAGLAGVGAAIYGIVTAPPERASDAGQGKPRRDVAVTPWVGGESAGAAVWGRF